jgi:hypothetical protein
MPIGDLTQIGGAFGNYGLQQQSRQQQQQFETKKYIGEQALKMLQDRAEAGDVQFLNDPDLAKHLKPFIGPQTMEATMPFLQKAAEMNANQNQMKANIAKFAAQLGQTQQRGGTLAPGAIPTLISSGESVGMKPQDLEAAGLRVKQEKTTVPAELNALAQARGYGSYNDAPTKVKSALYAENQKNKVAEAGAIAGARRETPEYAGAIAAARRDPIDDATARAKALADARRESVPDAAARAKALSDARRESTPDAAARAGAIQTAKDKAKSADSAIAPGVSGAPAAPGQLPPVMDFNEWSKNNPTIANDPKMARSEFSKDQAKYKKEVEQIRGIESAKQSALKISDQIVKYMDKEGLTGGGRADTLKAKAYGEFPNVSPAKYQKLYTLLSQLRAAAMPAYMAKGGPRSKAYLDQMTKHLPNPTDNPAFIREQISAFGPFVDTLQDQNRRSIADDFGVSYTPIPSTSEALDKYKKPDGTYDLDAIAKDPSLK